MINEAVEKVKQVADTVKEQVIEVDKSISVLTSKIFQGGSTMKWLIITILVWVIYKVVKSK